MAPKLSSKRARKQAGEGSSSLPTLEFNRDLFRSEQHQHRYDTIKGWSFLKERRVELREDDYLEFTTELARRSWTSLSKPLPKFDLELVLEFYTNAWPTQEGVMDQRSRV